MFKPHAQDRKGAGILLHKFQVRINDTHWTCTWKRGSRNSSRIQKIQKCLNGTQWTCTGEGGSRDSASQNSENSERLNGGQWTCTGQRRSPDKASEISKNSEIIKRHEWTCTGQRRSRDTASEIQECFNHMHWESAIAVLGGESFRQNIPRTTENNYYKLLDFN